MKDEKFDPNKMLAIIEQLKAEGRLPSGWMRKKEILLEGVFQRGSE